MGFWGFGVVDKLAGFASIDPEAENLGTGPDWADPETGVERGGSDRKVVELEPGLESSSALPEVERQSACIILERVVNKSGTESEKKGLVSRN